MNRIQPSVPAPPQRKAQAIFARCRDRRHLVHAKLESLDPISKTRLIHYLTAHRMPVYHALVKENPTKRQELLLKGYTPGHTLPTGLTVWKCPTHQIETPAPPPVPAPLTLADVATIRQRK